MGTPSARGSEGGGRGDANRVNGPPQETITISVEIDAADQLEKPAENGVTVANGVCSTARRTRVFLTTRKYTPDARAFARS